jgi:hypothetical protein
MERFKFLKAIMNPSREGEVIGDGFELTENCYLSSVAPITPGKELPMGCTNMLPELQRS